MIPITAIIARNRAAVERVLGPAQKIEVVRVGGPFGSTKAYYLEGEIEIVYIDNVADWIIISNKKERTTQEFIRFFALSDLTPPDSSRSIAHLYNVFGLKEIIYITNAGILWRVHIKTFTA